MRLAETSIMATSRDGNGKSSDVSKASTPELFSGLIADAKEIAIGHLGKMRGEIGDEFKQLKNFLAKIAITVGVVVVGSILIGHTLALGIAALGVPMWASYLIASVLAFGAGFLILKRLPGDKTNMDLVPESAMADFKRDMKEIKRGTEHALHH
jgi:hypothetical protein